MKSWSGGRITKEDPPPIWLRTLWRRLWRKQRQKVRFRHPQKSNLQPRRARGWGNSVLASLIEETLSNRDWALGRLAADAEMPVERINELLEGDRPSDVELQKLAQRLVKLNGE